MAVVSPGSNPQLLVCCETWLEFIERYASDLRTGGLFVATDDPPPVLTALDVRLQLPEATELVLRARVVQVLSQEQAHAVGKPPGVGLELADMDPERKRQIAQLLEFARWQGEQNDPNASFTRMLLEMSPSLPATEVGYRLSLLPGAIPRSSDIPTAVAPRRAPANTNSNRAPEAAKAEPVSRQRLRAASGPLTNRPPADAAAPVTIKPTAPAGPPRPSDPLLLKRMLSEFAHKHYEAALRTSREMLESNPGDPQALRWQHMCNARLARARNDEAAAAEHYALALPYDEENREAREYIRVHRRDKKLNSIPFGRYFTKKK
jgi:uncharacterized protein (TIGR02266 family)